MVSLPDGNGHGLIERVLRKDSGDVAKEGLFWTPERKRQRGQPRTTWKRSMEKN